jgi:PEP-CTERM motif
MKRLLLPAALCLAAPLRADLMVFSATADTAIYQNVTSNNGGGDARLSVGLNSAGSPRRGLFQFDLSTLPAGAVITAVSLQLSVDFAKSATGSAFDVHRLTAGWTEGTKTGGKGSAAAAGEATWNARQQGSAAWSSPGGDFLSTISASTLVGGTGAYTWSGAGMVADAQAWADNSATNFGWILFSNASGSAKRFGSSENTNAALRPQLSVTYSVVPEPSTFALVLAGLAALGRRLSRK